MKPEPTNARLLDCVEVVVMLTFSSSHVQKLAGDVHSMERILETVAGCTLTIVELVSKSLHHVSVIAIVADVVIRIVASRLSIHNAQDWR